MNAENEHRQPTPARPGEREFDLSGGALSLDFANTVADRPYRKKEYVASYGDFLAWAHQAGAISGEEADRLASEAARQPSKAEETLARAFDLREAVFEIFARMARDERPSSEDVALLNQWLERSLCHLRVRESDHSQDLWGWAWAGDPGALERPLWPVARDAADLLASEESGYLRECDAHDCSWLFIDRSRTRKRRWCSMKSCGNRAKARAFYKRKREAAGS